MLSKISKCKQPRATSSSSFQNRSIHSYNRPPLAFRQSRSTVFASPTFSICPTYTSPIPTIPHSWRAPVFAWRSFITEAEKEMEEKAQIEAEVEAESRTKAEEVLTAAKNKMMRGDFAGATKDFSDAIEYSSRASHLEGQIQAFEGMSYCYILQKDHSGAVEVARRGLRTAQDANNDALILKMTNAVANLYAALPHPVNAIKYLKEAKELATKLKDKETLKNIELSQGFVHSQDGLPEVALQHFQEYYRMAKEEKDMQLMLQGLSHIAKEYTILRQHDDAIATWKETMKLAQNTEDVRTEWKAADELGKCYVALGNLEAAAEYHQKAVHIASRTNDPAVELTSLQSLAVSQQLDGDQSGAVATNQKLIASAARLNNPRAEAQGKLNLAKLELAMNKFDSAEANIKSAEEILNIANDRPGQVMAIYTLGALYHRKGDFDRALKQFQHAVEVAVISGNPESHRNSLMFLGMHQNERKEFDNASKTLHKAMELHEAAKDDRAILDTLIHLSTCYYGMEKPKDYKVYAVTAVVLGKKMASRGLLHNPPKILKEWEKVFAQNLTGAQ